MEEEGLAEEDLQDVIMQSKPTRGDLQTIFGHAMVSSCKLEALNWNFPTLVSDCMPCMRVTVGLKLPNLACHMMFQWVFLPLHYGQTFA